MKKNTQILKTRPKLSLGDLIFAVGSCTKNTKETVAAVADLLGSGQVRVEKNGRSAAHASAKRILGYSRQASLDGSLVRATFLFPRIALPRAARFSMFTR